MAETPARKRLVNTFDRMEFSTVGLASTVRASPFVLHFGGYEVGKVHKQVLRVYNTADYSHRVHVVPPGTPFFKSHVDKKHGVIAPGMCLDVAVEFCPKEWRYYYDCIRVHSEEENLLVPIHAYRLHALVRGHRRPGHRSTRRGQTPLDPHRDALDHRPRCDQGPAGCCGTPP